VTWYEFAQMIARQTGDGDDRIEPCRWRDVWGPAARPSYSVLGSARARLMRPLDAAVAAYAAEVETVESKQASRCASS
jgi:dTDP-4-dehydrorhamnose reductase